VVASWLAFHSLQLFVQVQNLTPATINYWVSRPSTRLSELMASMAQLNELRVADQIFDFQPPYFP
jgi:hypothetical protein